MSNRASGSDEVAELRPEIRELSDMVGELMQFWGFKRNLGRAWALLYLNPEPLSAQDVCEALQLSTGTVSMTLNELMRWGVVHKRWVQGERRDFFVAETDIWRMVRRVFEEREKHLIEQSLDTFERASESLYDASREEGAEPSRVELLQFQAEQAARLAGVAAIGQQLLDTLLERGKVDVEPLRHVDSA